MPLASIAPHMAFRLLQGLPGPPEPPPPPPGGGPPPGGPPLQSKVPLHTSGTAQVGSMQVEPKHVVAAQAQPGTHPPPGGGGVGGGGGVPPMGGGGGGVLPQGLHLQGPGPGLEVSIHWPSGHKTGPIHWQPGTVPTQTFPQLSLHWRQESVHAEQSHGTQIGFGVGAGPPEQAEQSQTTPMTLVIQTQPAPGINSWVGPSQLAIPSPLGTQQA
jgi:hypothetical protein